MLFRETSPSPNTIVSVVASVTASAFLLRTIANDLIPHALRGACLTRLRKLATWLSSDFTVVVDEFDGLNPNQMFEAASVYLGHTLAFATSSRVKVGKSEKEKNLAVTIDEDQELVDDFNGAKFSWILECSRSENSVTAITETRRYGLRFHRKFREMALDCYLPYVLQRAKEIREERKSVKLHTVDYNGTDYWSGINLDHPATFETIAMDSEVKKMLIDDLERFIAGKEYYRKVGKAWKRGYLLYGPPGTGKSSLVAAMANYLKFDVYDLDLKEVQCNSDLRRLLIGMRSRSILVVEDINCSIDLQTRNSDGEFKSAEDEKISLSGLLNFIDGLWSSCGDERIVIFTTIHKEKLDPALLRPGRMDFHLHMSYCDFGGFKTLAKNYLLINENPLFEEIEVLLGKVRATPAEIAGELMKVDDPEISLRGLIDFLRKKPKL